MRQSAMQGVYSGVQEVYYAVRRRRGAVNKLTKFIELTRFIELTKLNS